LAPKANRVLICDTDPLTTAIWSHTLFGSAPPWLAPLIRARHYALYLLLSPDRPWITDGERHHPSLPQRRAFYDRCKAELQLRNLAYTQIEGDWSERFTDAVAAIEKVISLDA